MGSGNVLGYYNVIYILSGDQIYHEMALSDFEAVYDRVAPMQSMSERTGRCVLVALDRQLKPVHIIAFKAPFDARGYIDSEWNLSFTDVVNFGTPELDRTHNVNLYDAASLRRKSDRKWLWVADDHPRHLVTQIIERVSENQLRFLPIVDDVVLEPISTVTPSEDTAKVHQYQQQLAEQAAVVGELTALLEQRDCEVNKLRTSLSQLQVELTKAFQRERRSRAPATFKEALRGMMAAELEVSYKFDGQPLSYQQVADHLDDPVGSMARACKVSRHLFLQWQAHTTNAVCEHARNGVMCGKSVERVMHPRNFVAGRNDRCVGHQEAFSLAN